MYGAPTSPDVYTPETAIQRSLLKIRASGGRGSSAPSADNSGGSVHTQNEGWSPEAKAVTVPHILFTNVVRTDESYRVDIFLASAKSLDASSGNPDFVDWFICLGMGPGRDNKGRRSTVTRIIKAEAFAGRLANETVKVVVTCLGSRTESTDPQTREMAPRVVWLPRVGQA